MTAYEIRRELYVSPISHTADAHMHKIIVRVWEPRSNAAARFRRKG
jgi:hypothetical protein